MADIDRRTLIIGSAALGATALMNTTLSGCTDKGETMAPNENIESKSSEASSDAPVPVYFTRDISSQGLIAAYEALGITLPGKVAIKLSTGEPGGHNFLQPSLIKELVQDLNGTIVECNTAYGGSRADTEQHYQVAVDHGFTAIADVDIQDADGSTSLPVANGTHLSENLVGSHFDNYDSYLSLAHFKGHAMGGFGGAVKNVSIGLASSMGKSLIHSAGKETTGYGPDTPQDDFLESMAEATKSVADTLGANIVYVNVMNRLSIDCDCDSNPAEPDMEDIGILASTDPVALDQACVDLVYAAPDGQSLIKRMEDRNGIHTLDYGASIGLGSQEYELIEI